MRRIVAIVLGGLAFVGASACSSTSTKPAATVNGVDLPTQDLIDELNAIGANTDYVSTLHGNIRGSTPNSYDAAFVAQVLIQEINFTMVHNEVEKRKLEPSDACKQQARDEVFLDIGSQDSKAGEALFNKFVKRYQDLLVTRRVDLLALSYDTAGQKCGDPIDGASYYKTHPDEFTKVCIQAIAVADRTTADNVVTQARGGADFQSLARDLSIDEQSKANGGDIGCALPASFNGNVAEQLKTANIGDVLDPFELQAGFGIFKIYARQPLAPDEAQASATQLANVSVQRNVDISKWIGEARAAANITVDPRYGTFDKTKFTIDPPAGAASSSSSTGASSSTSDTP